MVKKTIGRVTPEERDEIQALFERRNGLNELAKIVTAENDELYEKLVKDLGETGTKFQSWWDRMGSKYQWESVEGGNWEINFTTCEIYLVEGGALHHLRDLPCGGRSTMTHLLLFIGTTELLLIGGIALLLFGGKKLPEMMRGLGQGVREFKKGVNDIEAQAGDGDGKPEGQAGQQPGDGSQKAGSAPAQPKGKADSPVEDNGTTSRR